LAEQYINVGEISGVFGVKGWVKVFSFTQPRENILSYSPWRLKKGSEIRDVEVLSGKLQGKVVVAALKNISDREIAASLSGYKILINQDLLPEPATDEYYWHELIGLEVINQQNESLGTVGSILETGANDVLVIKGDRERLIPFLQPQTVMNIDLETGIMQVDWDSEF